ncbi:uncharacterized protein EHS24_006708 [Apiotrichum porosum]|uniref:Alcohol dehydrogenase-like N-terminal domain-containing protein n=1 Tax=Apiotrichum porosum TaxID=105984 RepID=A0A427Y2A9_9TREE|nr:uncharacterized protein EHS24_006708 [Apiotrichum porosum]RSH85115.1 hypothetical protein EHS24_006708 [Apiotrichum porosum]
MTARHSPVDLTTDNSALIYRSFGDPQQVLHLETAPLPALIPSKLRVTMIYAPVNPSDLIPITGAYAHRVHPPSVAGYEGVGLVVSAPKTHAGLVGRRVLPLRGVGTWQTVVDCDPELAVPVPDEVDDLVAARAYINPLAAITMLDTWPVAGKRVLLSGAGSACAELLGLWALKQGATTVVGIYRSEERKGRLLECGIKPVQTDDTAAVAAAAAEADLTFDAIGGHVGSAILDAMRPGTVFIAYGLLSGQPLRPSRTPRAKYELFHLRNPLATMTSAAWQGQFRHIWPMLLKLELQPVKVFPLEHWQAAIEEAKRPGGTKPILSFPFRYSSIN